MVDKLFDNTCLNVLYLNFQSNPLNKQKNSSVSFFPLAIREFYPLKQFSNLDIFQDKYVVDVS